MLLHLFWLHTHHILPLPVLDHVEGLKCANNVFLCEGRHFTEGEVGEKRMGGREGRRADRELRGGVYVVMGTR